MEPSDRYLIQKLQEGVQSAFKELYDRYQARIFSYIYRLTGNRAVAEELVQTVFIRVYTKSGSYGSRGKVSSWIYAIAANCVKNELRARDQRQSVSLDTAVSTNGNLKLKDVLSDASFTPDTVLENKELKQQIEKVFNMLPVQYKEMIIARDMHQLSHDEIADIMQCSKRAVTVRLSRARKAFARLFNENFGQGM